MFNGSRFFHLLRKWKAEGKDAYIRILQDVMDHYFGSIAGYKDKNQLEIQGYYFPKDIEYVLDRVGYHNYSIEPCSDLGLTLVTLSDTL